MREELIALRTKIYLKQQDIFQKIYKNNIDFNDISIKTNIDEITVLEIVFDEKKKLFDEKQNLYNMKGLYDEELYNFMYY
jgi:hypothetical protein